MPSITKEQGQPAEVLARPASLVQYQHFTDQDALSAPYQLPGQFLGGIRPEAVTLPESPLIVFINARSGGNKGPELALALCRALGKGQVFDLSVYKPRDVLQQLWENFKTAIAAGVPNAAWYQSKLRILVAGGDGTITWVLAEIKKLKLTPAPPVAIMPLGTGNDLSRSLGWGPAFEPAWIEGYMGIYNTLLRISHAKVEDMDCWSVRLQFPDGKLVGKMPHCISTMQVLDPNQPPPSPSSDGGTRGPTTSPAVRAGGLFWNYVSVGLDARAAYNFHHLREESPHLASHRLLNQFWYSFFSCTSGWFCCTKPVSAKAQLHVLRPGLDEWVEVKVPSGVKALVILNLQSYAGGRNLWGQHHPGDTASTARQSGQDTFQEPTFTDGRLEVVGLLHGYHTMAVMGTKGELVHAKRICQANAIRISLRAQYVRSDGMPSHAYLQVDGEPWIQDVPSSTDAEPIVMEITHAGVSKVLHNTLDPSPGCFGCGPQKPLPRKLTSQNYETQGTAQRLSMRAGPLQSAMASMAGTVGADSDMVQVGSERASSMHSGNSWATAPTAPHRTSNT